MGDCRSHRTCSIAFILSEGLYLPSQTSSVPTLQTSVARRGDLTIYVSGNSTLAALDEVDLGFTTSGQVKAVNVDVLDEVKAGDLLAELDSTDCAGKIRTGETSSCRTDFASSDCLGANSSCHCATGCRFCVEPFGIHHFPGSASLGA